MTSNTRSLDEIIAKLRAQHVELRRNLDDRRESMFHFQELIRQRRTYPVKSVDSRIATMASLVIEATPSLCARKTA